MHQFAETKQFSLPSKQYLCPFLCLCYLMQIILLSSCIQIQTRHLSLDTPKKANNLVNSYAANRATSLWPFLLQISTESAAGNQIYSIFKHWQADLMWSECCNIIISWDTMPVCSQWHFCFLQFVNCSSLIIKQMETGDYFWLFLQHIYHCILGG